MVILEMILYDAARQPSNTHSAQRKWIMVLPRFETAVRWLIRVAPQGLLKRSMGGWRCAWRRPWTAGRPAQ
jgi:hypothetical protein